MRFLHGATSTEVRSEARFDDDEVALGGNLRNFQATQIAHDRQNPHDTQHARSNKHEGNCPLRPVAIWI